MAIFVYSAAHQDGSVVRGEKEAENEKNLAQSLHVEGLFLLEAKSKADVKKGGFSMKMSVGDIIDQIKPIGLSDKMFFARNLAVMIDAGLPLNRSLGALAQEMQNPKFKKIIDGVNDSVTKGKSFAESLKIYPNVFGDFFISMVEVGETTGKLTLVLKLIARQMKKDYDLRKRVKGAMIYPSIILSVLIIIGGLMMIYVIPTLATTIRGLGVDLPITTQVIIAASDFMVHYTLWVLLGVISIIILFWRLLKTKKGQKISSKFSLKFPIFGPLVLKFNVARFARSLSYLTNAGVPIVRSLEITGRVLGNTEFKEATFQAASEIQKGKQLHIILGEYPKIFHPLVLQMIEVGEETGKISAMLLRLATFFEGDVDNATKNLSSVIEPLLMVFIGAVVGFFAISIIQPIYSSLSNIH